MTLTKMIVIELTTIALILLSIGLFSFLQKAQATKQAITDPYKDSSTNLIYNLLFCDNLNLYNEKTQQPYTYPFDILFAEPASVSDLQKIIDDTASEPRTKVLAYNKQLANGYKPNKKELLAVIIEVGLMVGLMYWHLLIMEQPVISITQKKF